MGNKYIKVVYQTEPIGKERIILYLTTFDIEAYDKEQNSIKQQVKIFELPKHNLQEPNFIYDIEKMLNDYVKHYYEPYIEELKEIINTKKIMDKTIDLNAKNITNSDDVHCNIVYGNITNCDNIYCNEIKGNVVNCDKIIYKQ